MGMVLIQHHKGDMEQVQKPEVEAPKGQRQHRARPCSEREEGRLARVEDDRLVVVHVKPTARVPFVLLQPKHLGRTVVVVAAEAERRDSSEVECGWSEGARRSGLKVTFLFTSMCILSVSDTFILSSFSR